MRYEDASQTGAAGSDVNARDDADHLAANDFGPATGNLITGAGTITGATGTDSGGKIVAIMGAGGSDDSIADGKLEVAGQYGTLTIDAEGNYTYVRNPGTPEGVSDTFTYTLANAAGATDTANLVINIGDLPILQAQGTQTIRTADGVIVLPPGVELSDVRVVGRDLVITLPDGSTMVIPDGAIFVPRLVLDGVEVPASNLAALLIGSEPKPAAGDLSAVQQSSGGNFGLPPGPLDPGVPLGDLIPPTELFYTPPEVEEIFDHLDEETVAGTFSVQLDDDVIPGKGGNPGGTGDDAPDTVGQNVASGVLPGSGGDGSLAWALLDTGAPAGFTYDLQPDGSIEVLQTQDGSPVVVLTITVVASTGAFVVTQNNPIRHPTGDNENNVDFVINYSVTDDDGDVAIGTLNINVDDDTPTATVTAGSDANVILTTDDADTIGVNSDTAVTLADFSGVFTGSSSSPGADGAGAGTTGGYALAVTAQASGLFSHGSAINLFVVSGTVVGTTAGSAPASLVDPSIVFTVAVNASGVVTLTQMQQIDHSPESPSGAPFNDQFASMADGLVTLTRTLTVIDKDGDSVTASATVNIGQNLHFTDDGPTIDPTLNEVGSAIVDESPPVEANTIPLVGGFTAGDDPHLSGGLAIGKGSTSGAVVDANASFGADGPAASGSIVYDLVVMNTVSGLTTTEGTAINLVELSNGVVVGVVQGTSTAAFAIQIDPATGVVTVEQYLSLSHPLFPDNHDEPVFLNEGSLGVTVTAEDFDGDTATSDPVDITPLIRFEDDGPDVSATLNADAAVELDETLPSDTNTITLVGGLSAGDDPDLDGGLAIGRAVSAESVLTLGTADYGADGPAANPDDAVYSLTVNNASSGLTTTDGTPINLVVQQGGTVVVGVVQGTSTAAFAIQINAETGVITVEQYLSLDHPDASDPNDPLSMTAGHISAVVTIEDGDQDTDASNAIDISGLITFRDDGPAVTITAAPEPNLIVDETDLPDSIGPVSFIDSFDIDFGADGPASSNSRTFSLSVTEGPSGLVDTLTGNQVFLFLEGGQVVGREGTDALDAETGATVFTVSVNSDGEVTLNQQRAVVHGDPTDPDEADTPALLSADDLIKLNVTVEDGDGDTASASINIARNLRFEDDGPSISRNGEPLPSLVTDDTDTPNATDGPVSLAGLFSSDFGNDGPKDTDHNGEDADAIKFSLSLKDGNGTDSGLNDVLTGDNILLRITGSGDIEGYLQNNTSVVAFTIDIDANAGTVSLEQDRAITHDDPLDPVEDGLDAESMASDLIVVTATITDGDGDTDTATANIGDMFHFEDDGPSISRNTVPVPELVTDDTSTPNDTDGPVSFAGLFTSAFGKDSFKDSDDNDVEDADAIAYSLSIDGGNGTDSGLNDVLTGDDILLRVVGNTIEGYLENDTDTVAFTLTLNPATGAIGQEQDRAITHDDPLDPVEDGDDAETMAAGLIVLTATITDGDGDTATANANIGDAFNFEDDGPTCTDEAQQSVAENSQTATGTFDFDAGADGGGVTHLNGTLLVFDGITGWSQWIAVDDGQIRAQFDGSYEFQTDGNGSGVTSGTFTVTDGDGDTDVCDWAFNITDASGPTAGASTALIDDDGLVGSPDGVLEAGNGDINANVGEVATVNPNEAIFHGDLNADFGADGAGTIDFAGMVGQTRFVGTERVVFTWDAGSLTLTAIVDATSDGVTPQARAGTELFEVVLDPLLNGNYTLTLLDNVLHASGGNNENSAPNVALTFTIVDSDNSPPGGTTGTLNVTFNDDTPDAAISVAGLSISHDETPGNDGDANDVTGPLTVFNGVASKGDDPDVLPNGAGSVIGFATSTGAVASTGTDFGADGGTRAFSLTISNLAGTDSGLNVTGGQDIILFVESGIVVGRVSGGPFDGQAAFAIAINSSTGVISMVQYLSIQHTNTASLDESTSILNAAISAVVTATDGDGDVDTASAPIGSLISFQDDGPTTYEPEDASVANVAGAAVFFDLDDAPGNDDIGDNFGADGPGVVRFPSTLHASDSGETSGGVKIWYFLSNDGQTLTARTGADATAAASGTIIFTVNLNQATDQYSVQMFGTVDNLGDVIFNEANFDFVGGNETWFGIVPNDQGPDDTPVDDESKDLLITPTNETTVNTSGILGGIDTGQSVGTGEGFRIDYVIDLTGEPAGGGADYQDGVDNGHLLNVEAGDIPSHYTTNGAFFTVRQSGGSDILLKAFDDTDNDNVVGDGTQDAITKIIIRYTIEGVDPGDPPIVFSSGDLTPTTTEQFVTLNGIQFSYELDDDLKSVHVGNVQGATGANTEPNTTISTFTANGYNSLEVHWEGGETFKFAGFGILGQLLEPVEISLPTEIVDGDGDVVAGGDIDLTLTPPAPPIVLDMDGDGAEFAGLNAGVAYDYGHGLVATAWAGADDGILVRDANGDGDVTASEFVFGGNGETDMEALHAQYGAQLDASDADFTMFAVWNDANSNGVVDGNELQSLAEAGITSIGLVSDGIAYSSANGDVQVAGTASYTRADGSTGDVADAVFATGAAKATQEVERVAANSNSVTLAAAVAAAGMAASTAAAAQDVGGGDDFSAITNALVTKQSFADLGLDTAYNSPAFEFGNAWDVGFGTSFEALSSSSYTAIAATHIGELSASLSLGSGPTALLEATDIGAMLQMPALSTGMEVAMASPASLMPALAGVNFQTTGAVEQILADALQGGGASASIDAILNALPGQGLGDNAGLHGLATSIGNSVSFGDMGHGGVFTFDAGMIITSEAMVLHHDAVQPVANG